MPASYQSKSSVVPPPPGIAVLSIMDFGAVPNDNCSDHEAFRAAAAWINARGGYTSLSMPDGEFIVGRQWFGAPSGECMSCFTRFSIPFELDGCHNVDIYGKERTIIRTENCLLFGRFVKIASVINAKVNVSCSSPTGPWNEVAMIGPIIQINNCSRITMKMFQLDGNIDNIIIGGKYNYDGFQISHDGIIITSCREVNLAFLQVHHFGRDGLYLCSGDASSMKISIENCEFRNNIRQGLSWGGGNGLTVSSTVFNFNGIGRIYSSPACGFDAEMESTPYCPTPSTVANGSFTSCSFIGNKFCGFITDQANLSTNNISFDNCLFQASASPSSYCSWQKSKAITYSNCTFYGRVGPCYDASVSTWPPSGPDNRTKFINCKILEEDKSFTYIQNPATTSGSGCEYFPNILEIDFIAGRVVFDRCEITVNCNGRVWLRGKSNATCSGCPPYANAIDIIGCKIKSNGREVCTPSFSEPFTFHQINLNGVYTGVLGPSTKRPPGTGTYYWGPGTTWNGTFGYGTFSVPPFAPCLPLYTDPPTTPAITCGQSSPMPIPYCEDETENLSSDGEVAQFGVVYAPTEERLKILDLDEASVMDDQMYELYDASGRIIQTGHLNTISDGIKVPFLSTGIYLLHLTGQDSFARFIVNRVRR